MVTYIEISNQPYQLIRLVRICRLVLSIDFVSVCATGPTALDAKRARARACKSSTERRAISTTPNRDVEALRQLPHLQSNRSNRTHSKTSSTLEGNRERFSVPSSTMTNLQFSPKEWSQLTRIGTLNGL